MIDIAIEFIKKNNLELIIFIFLIFFFHNIKQGFISSLSDFFSMIPQFIW